MIDWDRGKQCVLWSRDDNVSQGLAEGNIAVEGPQYALFSSVPVNKCFVMYEVSKNTTNFFLII
jgi:hypothetical protein